MSVWKNGLLKSIISFAKFLRVLNRQEFYFLSGKMFSYEDYASYSAGESKYFLLDCSKFTQSFLEILPPFFSATAGPVLIEYYANPTISSVGAEFDVSNRKATSSRKNSAKLYDVPAGNVSSPGTRFTGRLIPSTGNNPNRGGGGEGSGKNAFQLNTVVNYLVKVTNTDGDGVYIQTDFTWIEG